MTPTILSSEVCENFDAMVRWHSHVFRLLMNENAVTYIFVNRWNFFVQGFCKAFCYGFFNQPFYAYIHFRTTVFSSFNRNKLFLY